MYHEPSGSIPAASQSESSFVCVPDSSAREANGRLGLRDARKRLRGGAGALDLRGIAGRPHDDEVVMHDGLAAGAVTSRHELLLGRRRVHEEDIGVAVLAQLERLAGPDGDRLDRATRLVLEGGQQLVEQPRVLRARRGGEDHLPLVGRRRRVVLAAGCDGQRRQESRGRAPHTASLASPLIDRS